MYTQEGEGGKGGRRWSRAQTKGREGGGRVRSRQSKQTMKWSCMAGRELTSTLMKGIVGINPMNSVAIMDRGVHFGAAAYRMAPFQDRPRFTAGLHLKMQWFLDEVKDNRKQYLQTWNDSQSLCADIHDKVPMEMVDTLRFEQGSRLLVFGNLLLDVHRLLKKEPGYVLARTPGRIVSVRGGEVMDDAGERCSFMLRG